ncbi:MAG: GWxTD domain-containing protein [Flavobacteriales bacterium]|jgi:GWxTD domain-containing protein|nr:GWxTD domain-containing protein [Flavobacteriales bacterium]
MNKLLLITFTLFTYTLVTSQVDAVLTVKRFNSPTQPYIENYIKIYANSIAFRKEPFDGVQYNIQITQLIRQDTNIIDYKKYTLKNLDSSKNIILDDLIDQQRFYVLNNQTYTIEVIIEDLLTSAMIPLTIEKDIKIDFPETQISIADIELIESYAKAGSENILTKSGYNILPMVEDFFGNDFDKIAYYTEIYNTLTQLDSNGKYIVTQFIENYDNKRIVGDFNKIKRYTSTTIQPILKIWDIESLPTGNYHLVVQVRDKNNTVLAEKKQRFQRLNLRESVQIKDLNKQEYINTFVDNIPKDSLNDYIKCLSPIASELERNTINNQLEELSENMKREFIFQFWKNKNAENPLREWVMYQKRVRYVQKQFSTRNNLGYETDRGRIYLQYGMPNSINDKPNSNYSYPYQVWHYYRAGKFNNKTCIFYSPNMIGNEYILLHSDIPGENKDINWQRTLKKRSSGIDNEELKHQSWEQY